MVVDACRYSMNEAAVSAMMGRDRVADHQRAGTQVLTATDMSWRSHFMPSNSVYRCGVVPAIVVAVKLSARLSARSWCNIFPMVLSIPEIEFR